MNLVEKLAIDLLRSRGYQITPPGDVFLKGNQIRQAYYGLGEQPIDVIVRQGWGPDFAAGNVLKYIRRNKGDRTNDVQKAIWYYDLLHELSVGRRYATQSITKLRESILTREELSLLTKQSTE